MADIPELARVVVKATAASGTGTSLRVQTDSTMTVQALKELVFEQFQHSEVPEAEVPISSWSFQLKGRLLKDEFPLFSYHPKNKDVLFLRVQGDLHGGFANCFPWQTEPVPEPEAMSTAEIKAQLKAVGAFRPALTFDQLVECLQVHQQRATRSSRLTKACAEALCAKSLHVRRKLTEVARTGKHEGSKRWISPCTATVRASWTP